MIYIEGYEPRDRIADRITEHKIGRRLLSYGLLQEYGIVADVRQENGKKPYLENFPQIYFNISHTRGLVVCGISSRAIGVDAEYIRDFDVRLMRRVCSAEEIDYVNENTGEAKERFFRLWTVKESYLKYTGEGLSRPMRQITESIPGAAFRRFRFQNKYMISICEEEINHDL